jgi:hypothetical protein
VSNDEKPMEEVAGPPQLETGLVSEMVAVYNSFAQRQKRLGAEFEAAIFSDLESLYED